MLHMPEHEHIFRGGIERLRAKERVERLQVQHVVSLCLQDFTGRSLLDVGTGSGLFAGEFEQHGMSVTGIDLKRDMLAAARREVPQGSYFQATAEKMPFLSGAYDLVFLGMVLHESHDLQAALHEACRVTSRRVGVLDWLYRTEEIGPSLEHRLHPDQLESWAKNAGMDLFRLHALPNAALYLMDKQDGR